MKITRNWLKLLMMLFMTMDHVAYSFLSTRSAVYQVMRLFGRMVAPTMCYLLVEGFRKTSSRWKYVIRMFIFALLAYEPFVMLGNPGVLRGTVSPLQFDFDMLFTLTICLLMLMGMEKCEQLIDNDLLKLAAECVILGMAIIVSRPCDWPIFAPLYTATFYLYGDDDVRTDLMIIVIGMMVWYYTTANWNHDLLTILKYSWCNLGVFAIIFIRRIYAHEKGEWDFKYFFYAYYAVHLLVISLVKFYMQGGRLS